MNLKQPKLKLFYIAIIFVLLQNGCSTIILNDKLPQSREPTTSGNIISSTPESVFSGNTNGTRISQESNILDCKASGEFTLLKSNVWLLCPKKNVKSQKENDSFSGDKNQIKVELPPEAQKILSDYWDYFFTIKKDTELIEIVNKENETKKYLQKIKINSPDGMRLISLNEATDITELMKDQMIKIRKNNNNEEP